MNDKSKREPFNFVFFHVELQKEILFHSKEFWEYYVKETGEDISIDRILERNGITDEKKIEEIKARIKKNKTLFPTY